MGFCEGKHCPDIRWYNSTDRAFIKSAYLDARWFFSITELLSLYPSALDRSNQMLNHGIFICKPPAFVSTVLIDLKKILVYTIFYSLLVILFEIITKIDCTSALGRNIVKKIL